MREIKFRAWDKVMKVYREVLSIDLEKQKVICPPRGHEFTEWYNQHLSFNEVLLLQYTGLKDRNGKEIYEGDILLFNNDHPNAQKTEWKCVVKYRKGSFVCEYPRDGVYNHFDSWNVPKVTWKVIGNVFENPELLEVSG